MTEQRQQGHRAGCSRLDEAAVLKLVPLLLASFLVAGCAGTQAGNKPEPVPDFLPGLAMGYLPKESLPDSLALLLPPPTADSAAFAHDEETARSTFALRDTPRWELAKADANLHFPAAAGTFSCALGAEISEAHMPYLYQLLRRTLTDAGLSTYTAKNHYQRPRPFMANHEAICTPDEQGGLEKDGSYPSGHTAVGWTWALLLSEISPEQSGAILARGLAYGYSRNVCNVHWRSDVEQGRVMGASVVARLHASADFRADLDAAKAELAAVRAKGLKPARDCAMEAAALARESQSSISGGR